MLLLIVLRIGEKIKKKIYEKDNSCVDNCSLTDYKYTYHSKCYETCPEGKYINNYICEDCHPDCKACDEIHSDYCKSCSSPDKFLNLGNCVSSCSNNGYYIDGNGNKICKCELKQCKSCSEESLNKNLCTSCNDGYYPIYDESYTSYGFFNCSIPLVGYYLDNDNNNYFYKLCYQTCKICDKSGDDMNHNCLECKNNYIYELAINNYVIAIANVLIIFILTIYQINIIALKVYNVQILIIN